MAWKETCVEKERMKFVAEVDSGEMSVSALCRAYGISRKTGYKWLRRFDMDGLEGLKDRSRMPGVHPNMVSEEIEERICKARRKHPHWGPKKLLSWLERRGQGQSLPATSTAGAILKRHGLVVARPARQRATPYTRPFEQCTDANQVWCVDLKGCFCTGDGRRCDPLTLTDASTRFLLRCQVLRRANGEYVRAVVETAFREYGLPLAIRSDNGSPFSSVAVGGLSPLSVWWLRLGIVPERIPPGRPQYNGRHERMHRTLKQETANPPCASLRAQQKAFDRFREEYNNERPHEALGQKTPAMLYTASGRPYPVRLPEFEYPQADQVRKVKFNGGFKWQSVDIYLSQCLAGELVGLEQVDERYWKVWVGPLELATLDGHKRVLVKPRRQGLWK